MGSWLTYTTDTLHEIIGLKLQGASTAEQTGGGKQLSVLADSCQNKLAGLITPDSDLRSRFLKSKYDITDWLQDS